MFADFTSSGWYVWFLLPMIIFLARVCDVSIGTIRLIWVSRGHRILATVFGFFEVLVWVTVIAQVMKNLSNPACYLGYSGGFAAGTYIGLLIIEKLQLGTVMIRVLTRSDSVKLARRLKENNYGFTIVDAEGAQGPVKIVFTVVPRKEAGRVIGLIDEHNPHAFYTVEEIGSHQKGIFPEKTIMDWSTYIRPFRKSK